MGGDRISDEARLRLEALLGQDEMRVSKERSQTRIIEWGIRLSEGKWLKSSNRGLGPSANQVSNFVIVPRNGPIEFDWL